MNKISSLIITFCLSCVFGYSQEKKVIVNNMSDFEYAEVYASNDSIKKLFLTELSTIVKEINVEIFKHNFTQDTLFCSYSKESVFLFKVVLNDSDKIENFHFTGSNICLIFNEQFTDRLKKLESKNLRFNQFQDEFHIVLTTNDIGTIEFFNVY